jgi:hypothetical protein
MDALRRLFGDDDSGQDVRPQAKRRELSEDERAVERYRYLLRTAPPETIEAAHTEAFSQLTPEQSRMVLEGLGQTLTPAERSAGVAFDNDPGSLARLATRAEMRQPGTLERTWSAMPAMAGSGGLGFGGLLAGNFLGTFAGVMLGSMIADGFLGDAGYDQGFADGTASVDATDSADTGDVAMEDSGVDGDIGGFGDLGDFGGDMGGFGDFGGDF